MRIISAGLFFRILSPGMEGQFFKDSVIEVNLKLLVTVLNIVTSFNKPLIHYIMVYGSKWFLYIFTA